MATDDVRTNGTGRFPNPSARRWQASDGTGVIWNGGPLERPCLANDTSTHEALALADLFQRLLPQQPGAGEEDE